jgi:hypothetical protein
MAPDEDWLGFWRTGWRQLTGPGVATKTPAVSPPPSTEPTTQRSVALKMPTMYGLLCEFPMVPLYSARTTTTAAKDRASETRAKPAAPAPIMLVLLDRSLKPVEVGLAGKVCSVGRSPVGCQTQPAIVRSGERNLYGY